MRTRHLGLVASAACILCAGVVAAWASAVPRWGRTTLRDVVVRYLRDEGDPVPAGMRYVRTVDANGASRYEVVLIGHFTANTESRPLGAAAPTGTTLFLGIDGRTGAITDMSLSNRPAPELGRLGPVRTGRL